MVYLKSGQFGVQIKWDAGWSLILRLSWSALAMELGSIQGPFVSLLYTYHVMLDQMSGHLNTQELVGMASGLLQLVPPCEQLPGQELPQSKTSTLIQTCLSAASSMMLPTRGADTHPSVTGMHSTHSQVSPNQTTQLLSEGASSSPTGAAPFQL